MDESRLAIVGVVALLVWTATTIIANTAGVKLINAIFLGLLISDAVVLLGYLSVILDSGPDLVYPISYCIISIVLILVYLVYLFLTEHTSRCICKKDETETLLNY